MLTADHIRAARAALNISVQQLADASGLRPEDIEAAESGTMIGDLSKMERLEAALSGLGIVLLRHGEDDPGVGPGLRWRDTRRDEGTRPEDLSSANDG